MGTVSLSASFSQSLRGAWALASSSWGDGTAVSPDGCCFADWLGFSYSQGCNTLETLLSQKQRQNFPMALMGWCSGSRALAGGDCVCPRPSVSSQELPGLCVLLLRQLVPGDLAAGAGRLPRLSADPRTHRFHFPASSQLHPSLMLEQGRGAASEGKGSGAGRLFTSWFFWQGSSSSKDKLAPAAQPGAVPGGRAVPGAREQPEPRQGGTVAKKQRRSRA